MNDRNSCRIRCRRQGSCCLLQPRRCGAVAPPVPSTHESLYRAPPPKPLSTGAQHAGGSRLPGLGPVPSWHRLPGSGCSQPHASFLPTSFHAVSCLHLMLPLPRGARPPHPRAFMEAVLSRGADCLTLSAPSLPSPCHLVFLAWPAADMPPRHAHAAPSAAGHAPCPSASQLIPRLRLFCARVSGSSEALSPPGHGTPSPLVALTLH